jgi:hypothetical protein
MIYPQDCIIQNYDVVSGATALQLPCFDDQQPPANGFKAVFLTAAFFETNNPYQTGPVFQSDSPAAVDIDLSPLIALNRIDKVRGVIAYYTNTSTANRISQACIRTDNGLALPIGAQCDKINDVNGFVLPDFYISQNLPIAGATKFSLQIGSDALDYGPVVQVCFTNYKVDAFAARCAGDPLFPAFVPS